LKSRRDILLGARTSRPHLRKDSRFPKKAQPYPNSFSRFALSADGPFALPVSEAYFLRQTRQRLAISKLDNVTVRIADHRKVTDNASDIHRWLNQNILLARQLGDSINFFSAVALKAEVIETSFHFILNYD
jgi:hypothetical protein